MGFKPYAPYHLTFLGWIQKTTKTKSEVWPIYFFTALVLCLTSGAVTWSFQKPLVWANRTKSTAPWEYDRSSAEFEKRQKILFWQNPGRIQILDKLHAEMNKAREQLATEKQ